MTIHIFIFPAPDDHITGQQIAESYLPVDEIALLSAIPHLGTSLERMAGRMAIRQILAQYLSEDAKRVPLATNKYGRPMVERGASEFKGDFNLSHANGWIAIAFSTLNRVGIDIEHIQDRRPYMKIAETWFHPIEVEHLTSLKEADREAEFYNIWSMKEAFLKGIGIGFKTKPNLFSVIGNSTRRGLPTWHDMPSAKWTASPLDLLKQYSVAVAVRKLGDAIPSLKVRRFSSLCELLGAKLFTKAVVQRPE